MDEDMIFRSVGGVRACLAALALFSLSGASFADAAGRQPSLSQPLDMGAAVERALRHNPGLGALEAQGRASEEGRKAARGAFGPKLGMTYSVTKQERRPASSQRPAAYGVYSWGVEVSQPVFQGFQLLAAYQKAAIQADSDRAAVRQGRLQMTEKVQTVFLAYLRAAEDCQSEREALERLRDQLRITRASHEAGLRPRLDVLQAEVDVSEAESAVIQAENTRETRRAELNTLLGLPATANPAYAGALRAAPFRLSLEQCLDRAYRQRPDLEIAAKSVAAAGMDQKEARSAYYPKIEAYYNVTQEGNTPDLRRAGNHGSRSATWEVGARATWDVFQWGTTFYDDQRAGWLVTRMRHEEEELKLSVGYDVKSKLLAVREAEKRMGVARLGVTRAQEAYGAAVARYREQVGTNFDVLDASSKLRTARASLTGARADYLTALAQIYVAMGEFHPDVTR